jgi:hypothetical protein
MATDATGAPTTLGIPKFNTSADAPSGLGSNAQMDAIDALLAARVVKPPGISAGEATVWNGASWDRSSVTKITANGVSGVNAQVTGVVVSGANTDLAWPGGDATTTMVDVGTTGGTLRTLAAANKGVGSRVIFRNSGAGTLTIKNQLAGGTGFQFLMRGSAPADLVLQIGDVAEFVQYGSLWVEVSKDQAPVAGVIAPTHLPSQAMLAMSSKVLVANTVYLVPIPNVTVPTSISRIDWGINTLVAGNYDVGIYYSDDDATFTLLGSKGSTAQPGAVAITTTIASQTITPVVGRRWYYALALSSASTVNATGTGGGSGALVPGFNKAASFPLPGSLTAMTSGFADIQVPTINGRV